MNILPEMYFRTRKFPINFGSHPDPDFISRLDLLWQRSALSKCCCVYFSMEEEFVEPPDELRIGDDDIEVCCSV